jgi:hypothetical protein
MSHVSSDADFVNHLRHLAVATPGITVPDPGAIVRAGRSRVARRRSVFAGAFGVLLFAGAGIATMPQFSPGATLPPYTPVAATVQVQPVEPLLTRGVPVEPVDAQLEAGGATAANEGISPWATGLGIAGAASLGTAAGLAVRSRRLTAQPAYA